MKKIYNKIVRDKLIDIYKSDVENKINISDFNISFLDKKEILINLKSKPQEEVDEVFNVYNEKDLSKIKEEMADVLEVISGMAFHLGFPFEEVLLVKNLKKDKKGGFETGLFLKSIDYLDK